MKLNRIYSCLFFVLFVFASCTQLKWVTFYGKRPIQISEKNKLITIYWNYFSEEDDIKRKLDAKIEKIKSKEHFKSDSIIFQSNQEIHHGIRTYVIRFFSNENEKTEFINRTKITYSSDLLNFDSVDFDRRLHSLKKRAKIKKVFKTIPELLNYKSVLNFYEDSTVMKVDKYELCFNYWGRLDTLRVNK
ncbi:MAG: hypothetical protein RIS29_2504 [Bacteroidota bacterium]|jgi:hypothetical protein